jgi:hypothetical protein
VAIRTRYFIHYFQNIRTANIDDANPKQTIVLVVNGSFKKK